MSKKIRMKCECGKLEGEAALKAADPFYCYCDDCQAYLHFLKRASQVLDKNGGTAIVPATPADLKITRGAENLRGMRLSEKGMFRFYAGCCDSPIANVGSPTMPYAGTIARIYDRKDLGPVRGRIQGKFAIGKPPAGTANTVNFSIMFWISMFLLPAFLRKASKPSPFFDDAGAPRVPVKTLSPAERDELRKFCGPHPTA